MRSLTGIILMLTGIVVGAQAYYPDTVEKHVHLAKLVRVLTPTEATTTVGRDLQGQPVRTFSPGNQLLATASVDVPENIKMVKAPSAPLLNTAPTLVRTSGWQAAVVPTGRVVNAASMNDAERWRLVRNLQGELRRAGCYWGKIDGSWGAGSKYAMQEFMLQVNASLPTSQPEPIMLTLLQSHSGTVCGKTCEDGYTKSSNGRCLPYAITAEKKLEPEPDVIVPPARLVRSGTTNVGASGFIARAPAPYPEGRMAVGGPVDSINPRYSAAAIASTPEANFALPGATTRANSALRPQYKTHKAKRKSAKRRKSAYRKNARRKALIRQAFGDGFD